LSIREASSQQAHLAPQTVTELIGEKTMPQGIVTSQSRYSVEETVAKLETLLKEKGIKLFAVIDHSGEAASVGLSMPSTKVLIFGNPKGGTPLMLAAPSTALDLPLKILVAEDAQGKVWLSWNDPAYLEQRHGFPKDLIANIAAAGILASQISQ
jgi:uncharacterized protein (DUF302 family)